MMQDKNNNKVSVESTDYVIILIRLVFFPKSFEFVQHHCNIKMET